ncbi:alpha/beta fold hydrolase [Sphingorhabdus sp. Alg239-R122]|uniref:alpha/beta hydrolase n=1 Tax=Sphingorhabdus sp. Alg239-R122 TaxID=2305989 RepID=UPI0013DB1E49|nr:alpha/beta fold hydrolase [Sphingorhabdus sp. Alg239-R122]
MTGFYSGVAALALFAVSSCAYASSADKQGVTLSQTTTQEITAPGPEGDLAGTMIDAGPDTPLILIIPGSGPTDRDGNNPRSLKAASYKLLAEELAQKNVSTLRVDKRGMFGSAAAVVDANKVTVGAYVDDINSWIKTVRQNTGRDCIWIAGHSEGGLMVLAAAQDNTEICGVITMAAPGRALADVLREQLRANPANASLLEPSEKIMQVLEAGNRVDAKDIPAPLMPLFAPAVQDFIISLFAQDPAVLAAGVRKPLLIVQGERDIQVSVADAQRIAAAQPKATLKLIAEMTHTLKTVDSDDRAANQKTYTDPNLPVSAELVETIADFVKKSVSL